MECMESAVSWCSWAFIVGGLAYFFADRRTVGPYGRYVVPGEDVWMVPAQLGWFLQELPAFLVPVVLTVTTETQPGWGKTLLLCTYCLHYFQRTFVYSLLIHSKPMPLRTVRSAMIFCSLCGALQGHQLLHCAQYHDTWLTDIRLTTGLLLFFSGMAVNIHSDHILRGLRKPGETSNYKIPRGGMFEYVSGANFLGEIVEWYGFAIATWSLPAFSFAFFTMCSIGPRAWYHHRFYIEKFSDYPTTRKALIPFIF
ncbi:3-oxo-5-alpha-steroid 4-dehydrogenase 2a [Engraulis encrasicolus]|uniref:3-oxo-5-alpha-steroid 4-dehydrogenase 2a n=1 Tax=Engraulis encrasicolus TaxID=184585 RepID=UPI002FD222E0